MDASFNRVEAADLVSSNEEILAAGRLSRQCRPSGALEFTQGVSAIGPRDDTAKVRSSNRRNKLFSVT